MKLYLKPIVLFLVLSFTSIVFAQKSVNHYKYVVVPESYNFAEGKDRYQLNSLSKFLFNKYGFTAFMATDSLPDDLFSNRCLALYADAEKLKGSLFKTEIKVVLNDCYGKQVYETKVGSTREKTFDKAYGYALRNAFESFQFLNYQYKPLPAKTNNKEPAKEVVTTESKTVKIEVSPLEGSPKQTEKVSVAQTRTGEQQLKPIEIMEKTIYYAQATTDGYRIIDDEPKLVMVLFRTAKENTFTVKDKNAIVYLEDGFWYFSEISEGKTIKKILNLKFYD